jgi:hypothetical protein
MARVQAAIDEDLHPACSPLLQVRTGVWFPRLPANGNFLGQHVLGMILHSRIERGALDSATQIEESFGGHQPESAPVQS